MMFIPKLQAGVRNMERFLKRYHDQITGVLSGPDRVLFRGVLRSISYASGLEIFLSSVHVLHKDFATYAAAVSEPLRRHAQQWAERHQRPYQYVESSRASKEDIARSIALREGISEGLICVLACVEPCRSFSVVKDRGQKKLRLVSRERRCLHLYYYYLDREFGLMHVRLQTWFPFAMQVCVNGREWLARKMQRAGLGFTQQDNCFTWIEKPRKAQSWMDQFTERRWAQWLNRWAARAIPWLESPDGRHLRGYYWTVRQAEFATDVMFRDAAQLDRLYPRLLRHAIEQFHSSDVLRFLGRRGRVQRFRGEVRTHLERRREGVRIKHCLQENWIKMYNKQGSVLRVETTINNARRFKVRRGLRRNGQYVSRWQSLRKGIADFRRRAQICLSANRRYLTALSFHPETAPSHAILDPVSRRCLVEGRPHRALAPISPQDSAQLALLQRGEFLIAGIRNRDLQPLWPDRVAHDPDGKRTAARITRWLRLPCAHGLLSKVPHTHCYRITTKGHAVLTTAHTLRHADVSSLAA
jgi:hypothetical protein